MCKLKEICSPEDKVEKGYHKHLCPKCNTCWKHSRDTLDEVSSKQFRKAHECPNCGEDVRKKHDDDSSVAFGLSDIDLCTCELPTFAIASLDIKYEFGFEVKSFETVFVTDEKHVNDKDYMKSKCGELLRKAGIEYDKLIGCEVVAELIPPPVELQEKVYEENGLVATAI